MSKLESILIGTSLQVLCPLLVTVLFLWSAAAISKYQILPITESTIVPQNNFTNSPEQDQSPLCGDET